MKRAILTITLLLGACASAVTKPPVPTDMPFAFDPNLCPSPILDWIIVEPNLSLVYAIGVHNRFGMTIEIDVIGTGGDPIETLVDALGKSPDPDGGWNQYFQIAWTPPAGEGLHYLEIRARDIVGRQDRRTLLVYTVADDAPFIFPVHGPLPVSRMKAAQRLVQVAKKVGFPLTKPITVR